MGEKTVDVGYIKTTPVFIYHTKKPKTETPVDPHPSVLMSPEARKMRQIYYYYNGYMKQCVNTHEPNHFFNMKTIGRGGTNYDLRFE